MKRDDTCLIDLGDYPHIQACGLAECYLLPDGRLRMLFFDWFKVDGLWRRMATGMLTRAVSNLPEDQMRASREINAPSASPFSTAPIPLQ